MENSGRRRPRGRFRAAQARLTPMPASVYYVYILKCADGTLYTGSTPDPHRRLREHNGGRGARYTRSRLPVELVYLETAGGRPAALRREHRLKTLTRAEKLVLIAAGRATRTVA